MFADVLISVLIPDFNKSVTLLFTYCAAPLISPSLFTNIVELSTLTTPKIELVAIGSLFDDTVPVVIFSASKFVIFVPSPLYEGAVIFPLISIITSILLLFLIYNEPLVLFINKYVLYKLDDQSDCKCNSGLSLLLNILILPLYNSSFSLGFVVPIPTLSPTIFMVVFTTPSVIVLKLWEVTPDDEPSSEFTLP